MSGVCAHCGRTRPFVDDAARLQHIRAKHPGVETGSGKRKRNRRSGQNAEFMMNASDAYAFVDALDLPDGAHWAMLEEMTGMEPADFVDIY